MTFTNQTNRTSATGSGSTGQEVAFLFPISATSDLTVYKRVTATGVQTTLTETTNYTVTISGDAGGTLTTVTAIETTEQIHIVRATPYTQSLDLVAGGPFNAENVEDALDKNTKLSIQQKDKTDRSIRFPETDPTSSIGDIPSSIDRASKTAGYDSAGKPNASVEVASGSVSFTTIGTNIAEAADAETVQALINGMYVINAKNPTYGATGDGSTDDSTAIQAAMDAAIAAQKPLYLPAGTYAVESQILHAFNTAALSKVVILGDEKFTTILDKCTTSSCLRFTRGGTATTAKFVLAGVNFQINADKTDYNVIEIVDFSTAHFSVRNCRFFGDSKKFKRFVYWDDLWEGSMRNVVFRDCQNGIPLFYDCLTANGGNVHFDNVFFKNCGPMVLQGAFTNNNLKFTNSKFIQTTSNYYHYTSTTGATTEGAKIVNIASTTGYTAGDVVFLIGWVTGDGRDRSEVNFIDEVTDATTLTMRYALEESYDSGVHLLHAPMNIVCQQLAILCSMDSCHFETYGVPIVLTDTRGWDIRGCSFTQFDHGIMIFARTYYVNVERCRIDSMQTGAYLVYCADRTNASEPYPSRITVGPQIWSYNDSDIDDQLLFTEFTPPAGWENRYETINKDGLSSNYDPLLMPLTLTYEGDVLTYENEILTYI